MHLAWRWFTGLGFDQEIPHHSTLSKNRHGRFQESKLFEQLFQEIVACCAESDSCTGTTCRSMAVPSRPMPTRGAESRASSWRRRRRSTRSRCMRSHANCGARRWASFFTPQFPT
jgi:hypothetical protein